MIVNKKVGMFKKMNIKRVTIYKYLVEYLNIKTLGFSFQ